MLRIAKNKSGKLFFYGFWTVLILGYILIYHSNQLIEPQKELQNAALRKELEQAREGLLELEQARKELLEEKAKNKALKKRIAQPNEVSGGPNEVSDAIKQFRDMTLGDAKLEKFQKVPGMSALDVIVWETHPKPFLMLSNAHLTWYTRNDLEKKVVAFMRAVLENHDPADNAYVLDMGINDGYIAGLAASYGYRVIGVDGQPECVRNFQFAKALNGWNRVEIYNRIVLNHTMQMEIPKGICGGGSRYEKKEPDLDKKKNYGAYSDLEGTGSTTVKSIRVDEMVGTAKVLFFHLDVEGAEPSVLNSAGALLADRRMEYISFEFAPHRWAEKRQETKVWFQKTFSNFNCVLGWDMIEAPIDKRPRTYMGDLETITDWSPVYDKVEARRKIVDVFCSLK